jgi:hypothetical protein
MSTEIGGMVSSTVLTLVVIPAIYAVVKGFALRKELATQPLRCAHKAAMKQE